MTKKEGVILLQRKLHRTHGKYRGNKEITYWAFFFFSLFTWVFTWIYMMKRGLYISEAKLGQNRAIFINYIVLLVDNIYTKYQFHLVLRWWREDMTLWRREEKLVENWRISGNIEGIKLKCWKAACWIFEHQRKWNTIQLSRSCESIGKT